MKSLDLAWHCGLLSAALCLASQSDSLAHSEARCGRLVPRRLARSVEAGIRFEVQGMSWKLFIAAFWSDPTHVIMQVRCEGINRK